MNLRQLFFCVIASLVLLAGCGTLDEKQREWIFQPSDRSWGNSATLAGDMKDVWIDFDSRESDKPARLHALWLDGPAPTAEASARGPVQQGPILLYLHGARWNVTGSAPRIRHMQELGFSVLAIDYRGFGKSTALLPSEDTAYEDAKAAWDWLAAKYPGRPRYIFGHSLGGAIGIDLATRVNDEAGVIVEGTFTSIAEVVSTFKWGWLPLSGLITQRFESLDKVGKIGSPLLVVHGAQDAYVLPSLGKKLYEAAVGPKLFVLVENGSHFSTNSVGQEQYRLALRTLFGNQAAFAPQAAETLQPPDAAPSTQAAL